VLSYDGTDYHGWQVQAGARTVQGTLVETARRRFGADTRVTGASRTDAGVHALGQVVSLATTARIGATGLRGALNADLPRDIRILGVTGHPSVIPVLRGAGADACVTKPLDPTVVVRELERLAASTRAHSLTG